LKRYFFKFFLLSFTIFFIGCSSKQVEINKEPNCKIQTDTFPTFVELYVNDNNARNNGWDGNLQSGNLSDIANHISKELKKYFPDAMVVKANKNIQLVDNYYYITITGVYKHYTYQGSTAVNTFHTGQFFSGFNSSGYYYGMTMPYGTTTYLPTIKSDTAVSVLIRVFNENKERILTCSMRTGKGYELYEYGWIGDCIEKLASCKD
jgi:hypothetical protein